MSIKAGVAQDGSPDAVKGWRMLTFTLRGAPVVWRRGKNVRHKSIDVMENEYGSKIQLPELSGIFNADEKAGVVWRYVQKADLGALPIIRLRFTIAHWQAYIRAAKNLWKAKIRKCFGVGLPTHFGAVEWTKQGVAHLHIMVRDTQTRYDYELYGWLWCEVVRDSLVHLQDVGFSPGSRNKKMGGNVRKLASYISKYATKGSDIPFPRKEITEARFRSSFQSADFPRALMKSKGSITNRAGRIVDMWERIRQYGWHANHFGTRCTLASGNEKSPDIYLRHLDWHQVWEPITKRLQNGAKFVRREHLDNVYKTTKEELWCLFKNGTAMRYEVAIETL